VTSWASLGLKGKKHDGPVRMPEAMESE
jgi:hypothetical protein